MKAFIDKDKLSTLPSATAATNNAPSGGQAGLPDPSLAQLISSQILSLQKNMETNFGKMVDKIIQIEGRMQDASQQLE
jgi:hypothetical protein